MQNNVNKTNWINKYKTQIVIKIHYNFKIFFQWKKTSPIQMNYLLHWIEIVNLNKKHKIYKNKS